MPIQADTFSQTAVQEIQERVAEELPGLLIAAQAVGLANHKQQLSDTLKRQRDAHKFMAKAAGFEVADDEYEDMGDIAISGDHVHYHVGQIGKPTVTTKPADKPADAIAQELPLAPGLSPLVKGICTALVAGSLGVPVGALLHSMVNRPSPAPSRPALSNADGGAVVRVFWGDRELKPGETLEGGVKIEEGTK